LLAGVGHKESHGGVAADASVRLVHGVVLTRNLGVAAADEAGLVLHGVVFVLLFLVDVLAFDGTVLSNGVFGNEFPGAAVFEGVALSLHGCFPFVLFWMRRVGGSFVG